MAEAPRQVQCPACGFNSHLKYFDNNSNLATYICERCKTVFVQPVK